MQPESPFGRRRSSRAAGAAPGLSRGAQWAAWSVAAVVAIVHLAVAPQYGIFRNELYFIVCGRHPAFGYVDQPPLVPLLAALTQICRRNLWLLRIPAVLAAIALGAAHRCVRAAARRDDARRVARRGRRPRSPASPR